MQSSIFLSSSSFYDLGNVDAVISRDVLVTNPSCDAETKPWVESTHCEIVLIIFDTFFFLHLLCLKGTCCALCLTYKQERCIFNKKTT